MTAPSGPRSNDDEIPTGREASPSTAREHLGDSRTSPPPQHRYRGLQIASLIVASLLVLAVTDGAIRLLDLMPLQRQSALQSEGAVADPADDTEEADATRLVVHPFRGFTPRPGHETEATSRWVSRSNLFGIRSMVADPRAIDPGDFVVGIFGGSVARGTAFRGREAMRQAILEVHPKLHDTLRIVNFAISGYKQPQQLYLLSELLLLGVPIDIVVNIDGFNEIALGGTDASRGHHPLYPEHNFWLTTLRLTGGSLSAHQIELTADIIRLRRKIMDSRSTLGNLPVLRHSALVQAAWGTSVLARERQAVALEEDLREESEDESDQKTVFALPDPCLGQEDGCRQLIAELWRRSSEQMQALAGDSKALYLHVLQPNQYVDGSKPMNAEELATAWKPERPWSRAAASGYPFLREAGLKLAADGVAFNDLSLIFQDHQETIYRDICCHYTDRGYQIFASEIGRLVSQEITVRDSLGQGLGATLSASRQR